MKIFYCNVTYTCNQNCIYCYSHNTIHNSKVKNEITPSDLMEYLNRMGISTFDRVIVNGGEPFLHTRIIEILKALKSIGCEVLIYTNGTLIQNFELEFLCRNFRFVIPIHGYSDLHDKITCHKGSFTLMSTNLEKLSKYDCLIDVKLILNTPMIEDYNCFHETISALGHLKINHAIHIQKMADTIISKKNNFPSVSLDQAANYTAIVFEHFKNSNYKIKLFDTCIKGINIHNFTIQSPPISVYFKDCNNERQFIFPQSNIKCRQTCSKSDKCFSAVDTYTVLEYYKGNFYKNLE